MAIPTNKNQAKEMQFQVLIHRLASNDPSLNTLFLDGVEHDVDEVAACQSDLQRALAKNTAVTKVVIGERIVRGQVDLVALLCRGVGPMPNLQYLEVALWDEFKKRKKVRATVLAEFLQQARKLETLIFWPFLFLVDQQELEALNQAFSHHPALQQVHLFNLLRQPPDDRDPNKALCLSSLVDALGTIPNLTHLQLAPGYVLRSKKSILSQDGTAASLVRLIAQAKTLQALTLRNVGLNNEHVRVLAETLRDTKNTSLLHLNLRYNDQCNAQGYQSLIDLLESGDNCTLQWLELDWGWKGTAPPTTLKALSFSVGPTFASD